MTGDCSIPASMSRPLLTLRLGGGTMRDGESGGGRSIMDDSEMLDVSEKSSSKRSPCS